jgi:hypothetical protein
MVFFFCIYMEQCGTHGETYVQIKSGLDNPNTRDHLRDVEVDTRIISEQRTGI